MKRASILILGCCLMTAAACAIGSECPDCTKNDGGARDDAAFSFDATGSGFDVQPSAEQDITVGCGQSAPTVAFTATAVVGWNVDRAEIGIMNPSGPALGSTFVPTGTTGGIAHVLAKASAQSVSRSVFVQLACQQNGPNADPREQKQIPTGASDLSSGGGVGGVGGEGLGPAVTDTATVNALSQPGGNGAAQGLKLL